MGRRIVRKLRATLFAAGVLVLLGSSVVPVAALGNTGSVGTWATTNNAPLDLSGAASVTANGYVYVIGGSSSSGGTWLDSVYYAKLNSDGSVGSWNTNSNPIPHGVYYPSAVAVNGYIYVMGGYGGGFQDAVYYAKINSDGSVGSWTASANSLPQAIYEAAAVTHDGYIYFIGGINGSFTQLDTVYYAKVNADGSIGTWTTSSNHTPQGVEDAAAATTGGRVYIMGGTGNSGYKNSVYYASLNADGSVGSWSTSATTLPQALDGPTATTSNGYLYLAGGNTNVSTTKADVYYTKVNADGSLASWTTSANSLPQPLRYAVSAVSGGYWYVLTGQNGGSTQNTVYSAQLNFTSAQSATTANNQPLTLVTPAGTNITSVSSAPSVVADSGYSYPLGLTSFTFTTDNIENQIALTFQTDLTPSQVIARKYNSTTHAYGTISGATITNVTLSGKHALLLTYIISDGGSLDQDGQVNGTIVDPVGLAEANPASAVAAPNTGYGTPPSGTEPFLAGLASIGMITTSFALRKQARRKSSQA